ncbi:hypothetical protein [Actinacidiphila acididurans]|uniref:Uncharacterized protein n=1 Tax=Actinacidiphila acididurans TaxID=2784346 RepID=A0ABS2U302_9ACTN|nr:hypothetical protein [Actinacidiphila acididurans]MBM9509126.1 hypothetical protein [Actinacidiphila acididurans]
MAIASLALPVSGLDALPNESRMIATPWSRMVRGIGLGQYPVDYDSVAAARIRETFDRLAAKMPFHTYTVFARLLTELILTVANPGTEPSPAQVRRALGPVVAAVRAEGNAYYRVIAGSILLETFAKLEMDPGLLVNDSVDLPAEILAAVDGIQPDRIKDGNRHGDYERLSAYSAVMLALGQLGLKERLVTGPRNHVREALDLLERIPSPFFRVRAASMLLSVISLLGYDALVFDGERDYMKEVLDHLDRTFDPGNEVSFPQPVTPRFAKTYPLLTLLNAIAMSGRVEYLRYGRDRLAEIKELMGTISRSERAHMTLYYVVALHNLGRLTEQVPDLDAHLEEAVGRWQDIDPGEDFFLHGVAYPYLIETAMITGRTDLITDEALERQADAFRDHDRTEQDRVNRPFPLSYSLNAFGEIGVADRLFAPRARYGGASAVTWVIDRFSENGREEGTRLTMVDHALISCALRLRGAHRRETELFRTFRFRLTETPGAASADRTS